MCFNPAFEDAIAQGKSWLTTCLQNHTSCAKRARHASIFCTDNFHFIDDLSGDGLVPSRLLALPISSPPKNDERIVKLVPSSALGAQTQYLALSHQWGGPEFPLPRTLESNLEDHTKHGIPYDNLPKTFRDAIDVTIALGYGYLWIDSLCIVQDSSEDWKKEARRMAIIYDNAILTIAAMDAENSSQGLFPTKASRVGSLESRAWVCQERLIAPRTLMFIQNHVAWECRQGSASSEVPALEQDPDEAPTHYNERSWVPPTRPKAIFAFFRDWRLPSRDNIDPNPEKHDTKGASFERCFDNIGDEKDKDPLDSDVLTEKVIVQDFSEAVSLLGASVDGLSDAATLQDQHQGSLQNTDPSSDLEMAGVLRNFSLDGMDLTFMVSSSANEDTTTHDVIPAFTWSDDDPPLKIWNMRPPKGESGLFVNYQTGTVDVFYGNDLAAHAKHLRNQMDAPVLGRTWNAIPGDASSNDKDPFGRFTVSVTDLKHPQIAYEPFLRVWWNFLALYTPRNLTYDSDAFLAMNGITSIAQRWTHIRSTFGLWLNFIQIELCWYIDPSIPATRPKTPMWLAPSWSWASTRGGLARNAIWIRSHLQSQLLIKPYIEISTGTAFDMPLPFPAWRKSRYHSLGLKGSLRGALLKRVQNAAGENDFEVLISPDSRYSDHEVCKFYPDCIAEIPREQTPVFVLPLWHFDGNNGACGLGHHLDVMLVMRPIAADGWIAHYDDETMPTDEAQDPRTMRRIGLLESTYGLHEMRDLAEIQEDWWYRYVTLV